VGIIDVLSGKLMGIFENIRRNQKTLEEILERNFVRMDEIIG
jgi:hypothetical protein